MKDLNRKAFVGLLNLIVIVSAALFIPAWTLHYWQAWVFLAVFSTAVLAITLFVMKNDSKLLERRMNAGPAAETRTSQKVIQVLASVSFIAMFIVPALDHRLGWSVLPLVVVAVGDVLVALGLLIVFFVFKENTFTAAMIGVEAEQRVVSTGPYSVVRHPMYAGALVMLVGVPLALGSWWGLLTVIPIALVIVWRLVDEERFLEQNLRGYTEYRNRVRCRLVPFIW